jgi:hypothetical protein
MNKKLLLRILFIGVSFAILSFLAVKYIPRTDLYRNLTTPKGESTTASDIATAFQKSEQDANTKYNGKIIEISGVVKESKIENSNTTVTLKTLDSMTTVYIVLKDSIKPLIEGENVKIKGKCSGYLVDSTFGNNIQFNEGEIIKK